MIENNEFCGYDPIINLPFAIDGLTIDQATGELYFPNGIITKSIQHFARILAEMDKVAFDRNAVSGESQKIIHRIYRTIGDTQEMVDADLKYDITVIQPGSWGNQFPTTTGHYHLPVEGSGSPIPSPDFYQVLSGEVIAVLQKESPRGTVVRLLQPKPGDWILIPGEYAHSVVNIGNTPAVFANVCVRSPHLDYKPILDRKGMAVYVTRDEETQGIGITLNRNYSSVASVAFAKSEPVIPGLESITHKMSLFEVLNTKLDTLRFLRNPDSNPQIFTPDPIKVTQTLYSATT